MHGKKQTAAGVVTERQAQAALRHGPGSGLGAEEEKVMRMRLGASLPLSARLERIAVASDAEIEILAYEIEGYLRMKQQRGAAEAVQAKPSPAPSRTKEKIIRALRKK